jgi:hypothetical protein
MLKVEIEKRTSIIQKETKNSNWKNMDQNRHKNKFYFLLKGEIKRKIQFYKKIKKTIKWIRIKIEIKNKNQFMIKG